MTRSLELDHYVGHLIRRAEQVHTSLWAAHVSREVTSQQFAVLNALARMPGNDQRTVASATSLDRSTVNNIVRRLTDQGYVSQVRDDADRRRTLLELTAGGAQLLQQLIPPAEHVNELLLASLQDGERPVAIDLLRKIACVDDAG